MLLCNSFNFLFFLFPSYRSHIRGRAGRQFLWIFIESLAYVRQDGHGGKENVRRCNWGDYNSLSFPIQWNLKTIFNK